METTQRIQVVLAIIATALAVTMGIFVLSMPWVPLASFDIIGVLWLLSNIPQIVACGMLLGLSILALYAWIQVLRSRM